MSAMDFFISFLLSWFSYQAFALIDRELNDEFGSFSFFCVNPDFSAMGFGDVHFCLNHGLRGLKDFTDFIY